MNLSESILKQAQEYLDGNMSLEDRKAFELQLFENQELADYISINKEMLDHYNEESWSFIQNDSNVDALENYLKSNEIREIKSAIKNVNDDFVKTSSPNKRNYFPFIAIAASVLLFVGYFMFNNAPSNGDLYAQYNDWSNLPSLTTRGDTDDTILVEGEKAFLTKDYNKAKIHFENFLSTSKSNNPNALLYFGISNIELNNYEEAIKTFNRLISSDALDSSKGYWYKALTYLKMEDRASSIQVLNEILKDASNYKYKEAQDLLKKLQD